MVFSQFKKRKSVGNHHEGEVIKMTTESTMTTVTTLTNGVEVAGWLEVSKGWQICAFLGESASITLTEGLTRGYAKNKNADLIRNTVQSRKDALKELGKY